MIEGRGSEVFELFGWVGSRSLNIAWSDIVAATMTIEKVANLQILHHQQ